MTNVMTPSKSMTIKQIDKAVSHYRAMLEQHRAEIGSSAEVQQVLGDRTYLKEQLGVFRRHVNVLRTLTELNPVEVCITVLREPLDFFQDRSGLWVWGDFRKLVQAVKSVLKGTSFLLRSFEISKDGGATDAEIEGALPKPHLFAEDAVAAIIAELISAQEGGKPGTLLNNGYANLFYTASLVVRVRWDGDDSEWGVHTWECDVSRWSQGLRVFVPSN